MLIANDDTIKYITNVTNENDCLHLCNDKPTNCFFANKVDMVSILSNKLDNLLNKLSNGLNIILVFANRLTILSINKWSIPPPTT